MGTKTFFVTVFLFLSTLSPSGQTLSQDTTVPISTTKVQVINTNKTIQEKSDNLTKGIEELRKEGEKVTSNIVKAQNLKANALYQRAMINKIIVEKEQLAKKTMRTPIIVEPVELTVELPAPIIHPDSVKMEENLSFFKRVFKFFKN